MSQKIVFEESEAKMKIFDKWNCYGPSYRSTLLPLQLSLYIHIILVHTLAQGPEGYLTLQILSGSPAVAGRLL